MRVLVAGWAGSTNLGDELIALALRTKLTARGVEISSVSKRRSPGSVGHLDATGLVKATGRADAVMLGGGSLIQDVTSPWNTPLHLSRAWLATLRRTPWAGVGLGAGPLDGRLARTLTRRTLPTAVALSVRDHASADLLAGLGVVPPIVAADLALSLPDPHMDVEDRLVVCLRPWSGERSLLPVHARRTVDETPDWFPAAAAKALDEAALATGLAVHFVALQADRDGPLHERVAERMSTTATCSSPTLDTVVDEIAAGRVVVAMRYHGGIAAALGGRPCVLVGYSPKVPALAEDLAPAATSLPWAAHALVGLPKAVDRVANLDAQMREARERLRIREKENDRALELLFEAAHAAHGPPSQRS